MLTKFERKTLHPLLQYCQELLLLMEEIPLVVVQDFFHQQNQLIQPQERNLPPESLGILRIAILNRSVQVLLQHTVMIENEFPKNDVKYHHTRTTKMSFQMFPNKNRIKDKGGVDTHCQQLCFSLHNRAMAACQGAIRQRPSITRTIFDVLHVLTCVTTCHTLGKIKSGSIPQPEPSSKRWLP